MPNAMRGPLAAATAVVVLLVAGWFALPTQAVIVRTATVAAPPEVVVGLLGDVEAWQAWSPWSAADPGYRVELGARTRGVGAGYSWTSDAGAGSVELVAVEADRVVARWAFAERGGAESTFAVTPDGAGSRVVWTTVVQTPGVSGGLFAWNADSLLGPSFEDGLKRLQEKAEAAR